MPTRCVEAQCFRSESRSENLLMLDPAPHVSIHPEDPETNVFRDLKLELDSIFEVLLGPYMRGTWFLEHGCIQYVNYLVEDGQC